MSDPLDLFITRANGPGAPVLENPARKVIGDEGFGWDRRCPGDFVSPGDGRFVQTPDGTVWTLHTGFCGFYANDTLHPVDPDGLPADLPIQDLFYDPFTQHLYFVRWGVLYKYSATNPPGFVAALAIRHQGEEFSRSNRPWNGVLTTLGWDNVVYWYDLTGMTVIKSFDLAGITVGDPSSAWNIGYVPYTNGFLRNEIIGGRHRIVHYLLERFEPLPATVGDLIRDLCVRAGLRADQIDTSQVTEACHGYLVNGRMEAREAVEVLLTLYQLTLTESGGRLVVRPKSRPPALAIPAEHLGAGAEEAPEPGAGIATLVRSQEVEVPSRFEFTYASRDRDWQAATRVAARHTLGRSAYQQEVIEAAIGLDDATAQMLVDRLLRHAWEERQTVSLTLPPLYLGLEPGDRVELPRLGLSIRVVRAELGANWVVTIDGVRAVDDTGLQL